MLCSLGHLVVPFSRGETGLQLHLLILPKVQPFPPFAFPFLCPSPSPDPARTALAGRRPRTAVSHRVWRPPPPANKCPPNDVHRHCLPRSHSPMVSEARPEEPRRVATICYLTPRAVLKPCPSVGVTSCAIARDHPAGGGAWVPKVGPHFHQHLHTRSQGEAEAPCRSPLKPIWRRPERCPGVTRFNWPCAGLHHPCVHRNLKDVASSASNSVFFRYVSFAVTPVPPAAHGGGRGRDACSSTLGIQRGNAHVVSDGSLWASMWRDSSIPRRGPSMPPAEGPPWRLASSPSPSTHYYLSTTHVLLLPAAKNHYLPRAIAPAH